MRRSQVHCARHAFTSQLTLAVRRSNLESRLAASGPQPRPRQLVIPPPPPLPRDDLVRVRRSGSRGRGGTRGRQISVPHKSTSNGSFPPGGKVVEDRMRGFSKSRLAASGPQPRPRQLAVPPPPPLPRGGVVGVRRSGSRGRGGTRGRHISVPHKSTANGSFPPGGKVVEDRMRGFSLGHSRVGSQAEIPTATRCSPTPAPPPRRSRACSAKRVARERGDALPLRFAAEWALLLDDPAKIQAPANPRPSMGPAR
jgi:hypothetical protein